MGLSITPVFLSVLTVTDRKERAVKKAKNALLVVVSAIYMMIGMHAQAATHWLAVEGSNCKAWSDEALKPGEVIRWSGGCEDGRLSGKGVLEVTASGKRQLYFEGAMRGGKAHGEGVAESQDESGKTRYTGGFANGLFDGFGLLELADGSRYEGGFKADQPDGYGLYQGADGSRYQGDLSAGVPQGEGFEVTADGAAYHGGFSAGARHGQGTLLFVDGGLYEGGFENGKAHGKGVFTALSGTTAAGSWINGKADGEFVITSRDGSVKHQLWRDDKRVPGGNNGGGK
jgi:hypothetical protein